MAQTRDIGDLGQVSITPANFVPEHPFSGPADMSATNQLIAGLGNLSDGVTRLGMAVAQNQKQKKADPEAARLALARASLEVAGNNNDPQFAADQFSKLPEDDEVNRKAYAIATANAYLDKKKSEWMKEAAAGGIQNFDWNQKLADAVAEGRKAGMIPTDDAAAAFMSNAGNLVDTFRTQGQMQSNNDAEYKALTALQTRTSTEFVSALKGGGAQQAQQVIDNLYKSAEFSRLNEEQKQKVLSSTINGMVNSGDVRAFSALAGIDGPDGVPLKDRFAQEWRVWDKQVRDTALSLADGSRAEAGLGGGASYRDTLKALQGPAKDYAADVVNKRNAAAALATETLQKAAAMEAEHKPVDIVALKAEAVAQAKADGVFNVPKAMDMFNQTFDPAAARYTGMVQDAANADARAKADLKVTGALRGQFDAALKTGGPEAAITRIREAMDENNVFGDLSYLQQGKMLGGLADEYARDGNTKALEALGRVDVDKQGTTLAQFMGTDWQVLTARNAEAAHGKFVARVEPLKNEARTAAALGLMSDELHNKLRDEGVPSAFIVDMWDKSDAYIAKKTADFQKINTDTAKAQFIHETEAVSAKNILLGRGDLLVGRTLNTDPNDPSKTYEVSAEDQWNAGIAEAERMLSAQYDVEKPGAKPEEKMRDIRVKVMQLHARNGRIDPNSKQTLQDFLKKSQRDGYSVGQDDLAQLSEIRDAVSTYSPAVLDEVIGTGKKRDYFDAFMARLRETDDPATAIAFARTIRDAPEDQKATVNPKRLDDLLTSALDEFDAGNDRFISNVLKANIERNVQLGASDEAAVTEAIRGVQSRFVSVNGQHVEFTKFAGTKDPAMVAQVLTDAADVYAEKHADELHGTNITFDNGDKPGTLRVFDADTGLPLNSKLINWSDIYTDYDKRILAPAREADAVEGKRREAELMERARAAGDLLDRSNAAALAGDENWRRNMMNPDGMK